MNLLQRLIEKQQLKADYEELFKSERGQRVLEHLCKVGFVTSPLASPDAGEMREREGMRRLVLSIMAMCNKPDDELIRLIVQEQQKESQIQHETD